jgi:hypothetical protein
MKPVEIDSVAAEDIDCGSDVTIRATDFEAYRSHPLISGTAIGYAAERLRKGWDDRTAKAPPSQAGMREALEQIAIVCTDNMDRDCDHRMALDFVRQIANSATEPGHSGQTKEPILSRRPVAFRVPRVVDDRISKTEFRYFTEEDQANAEAEQLGIDYQGLYVRDGGIV